MPLLKDIVTNLNRLKTLASEGSDLKALVRNLSPSTAKKAEKELKVDTQLDGAQTQTLSPRAAKSKGGERDRDDLIRNRLPEDVKKDNFNSIININSPDSPLLHDEDELAEISKHHPKNNIKFIMELLQYNPNNNRESILEKKSFFSTITNLSEGTSPNIDSELPFGSTEDIFRNVSATRNLSLTFILFANNKQEHKKIIKDLDFLTRNCYPGRLRSFGRQPPFIRLTIGDLYKRQLALISNLDKTLGELPWSNIEEELPLKIEISLSFNLLYSMEDDKGKMITGQPSFNSIFYQFSHTGLI